ncbi:MAG TPA: histidine kinase [Terracidiphilus sp.]
MKPNSSNLESRNGTAATRPDGTESAPPRSHLQLTGYIVISSLSLGLALLTADECQSIKHIPSLVYGLVLWGWWGIVAGTLWSFAGRRQSATSFSGRALAIHLPVALALGFVHLLQLWALGFMQGWGPEQTPQSIWRYLNNPNRYGLEILIYGFIFGIVGIIQQQIRAQREAMKSLELERQLSAAQLRALQMQLEPHFLFNTLNAITTLVELGRQAEAAEMLRHLNAILKCTLQRTNPEKVPLSQELEIIENYLAIEQVRFADRLRIEIKVEPNALDSLVPCFLLQPIVENAIQHGIAHCENEGLVQTSARRDGNLLRLRVCDSGLRTNGKPKPGNGIGLKNTRERLSHFYQDAFEMQALPLEAGGFEVAITIPYERN